MGIKANDDLFRLIKALSPAEKRAFKLLSERYARQEGSNYLQLLDAIGEMEHYDEAILRQRFLGKALLNNLSEAKGYLYRSLLRSLRFSQGPESPETELREVLDHLEILHGKGLYEQAERQVKTGIDKARQFDLHAFTAEFLRWKRRLAKWRGGKLLLQELASIGQQETEALQHLGIEAHLRDLMGRIQTILAQQIDLLDAASQQELHAIFAMPALRQPPEASGFHALSSYYYAHAYFHRSQGDAFPSMEAWEAVVATFEAYPVQLKRMPDQYANALASLIDAQLNNRRFEGIPEKLARMRALKSREPNAVARQFFLEQHLSFRHALVTGALGMALQRVPELEAGMAKHGKYMGPSLEMTLLYNLSALYFLAEQYPEAQRYINLALNRPHLPVREDIVDALRLLEMIARYARGQADVLEHLHRAQERRLRLRAAKHPFSISAHRFIGKLLGAADAKETKAHIADMLVELQTIATQTKPAGLEELNYWLRGRQEGKRIESIMQRDMSE